MDALPLPLRHGIMTAIVLERVLKLALAASECSVGCRTPLPEGSFLAFDPPGGG